MTQRRDQSLTDFDGFAARITAKAVRSATAHAENALRTRRKDSSRWRRAGLLWPLFSRSI